MDTRKHLQRLIDLTTILLNLSKAGIIICFVALISGEGAAPLLICVILALSLYFSMIFLNVIIDFYDAVVGKSKIENTLSPRFIDSQK